MVFELILTDKCNRNCDFCQISKGDYSASYAELVSFCDCVNKYNGKKEVNFFGGEPLLNIEGVDTCMKLLKPSVKTKLYTNGDALYKMKNRSYLNRIEIQVTPYDIFDNSDKYSSLCDDFNNLHFTYTFDQHTVDMVEDFKEICRHELNNNYKIALSHSSHSWSDIENEKLYNTICEITHNEIIDSITNKKLSVFIEPKVKRIYELKNNPNTKEFTCLSSGKMTFYKGRFLYVPCILYKNHKECPSHRYDSCKNCVYNRICTKSCSYETVGGEVPEKLCIIEKAQFDELKQFFEADNH